MPRRARVRLPGVPLHLIQRGNDRSACFCREVDYPFYLQCLAEQADNHDRVVHALCLLTNHVHLLPIPGRPESGGRPMKGGGGLVLQRDCQSSRHYGLIPPSKIPGESPS